MSFFREDMEVDLEAKWLSVEIKVLSWATNLTWGHD